MKKERKTLSAGAKLGILFLAIVLIFGSINLVWLVGVKVPYSKYMSKLEEYDDHGETVYQKIEGDYKFSTDNPRYMKFTNQLHVGDKDGAWINTDSDGNVIDSSGMTVSLSIITFFWGDCKYRVQFYDPENDIDRMIYVDEDMNYSPQSDVTNETYESTTAFLELYREEIENLFNAAKEFWDLKI